MCIYQEVKKTGKKVMCDLKSIPDRYCWQLLLKHCMGKFFLGLWTLMLAEGLEIKVLFWALSGRRSSLVQTLCQSCVYFDLVLIPPQIIQRFMIQGSISRKQEQGQHDNVHCNVLVGKRHVAYLLHYYCSSLWFCMCVCVCVCVCTMTSIYTGAVFMLNLCILFILMLSLLSSLDRACCNLCTPSKYFFINHVKYFHYSFFVY